MRRVILLLLWAAFGSIVLQARPINSSFSALANRADKTPTFLFQSVTVTGKVTDESGAGMPGVNVIVKGTTSGTTTDSEGSYAIGIANDQSATLVFSFIGYATQEQVINGRTKIDISMSIDVQALSEVVVVGYGTQKRSDVTGSIVSVTEQQLKDVPVSNLIEAMQGRAAGIDIQKGSGNSKPGSTPVIRIRGARSLRATNDPLFVVDGIPFNGSLNDISTDDITSIEVLKDASSTAIYGSRGANGVILVTTKRGKNTVPVVTYSGYSGIVKPLGRFNVMNGSEFEMLKKWSRINAAPGTYSGLDDPLFLTNATFAPQEVESIQMGRSTDWQDLIFKNGIMTNHQIGVSGGTEKTQYAATGGYFKETGIYPGQSFERASLKLSVDQQLGKRFKIGISSINTYTTTLGEGFNPMGQVLRASPLTTPYDPATGDLWGFLPGSANQIWNPIADFVKGAKVENRKRFGTFTTAYADVKIIEGLHYKFNAGAEVRSDVYGNYFASATSNNLGGLSTSSNRTNFRTNFTLENLLIYDKTLAAKHKINFTGLYSLQEQVKQENTFNNNTIAADFLQYYNPQFGANLTGTGEFEKWDIISYMGRLNYVYNDKYLLTLTMRSDGSSRLSENNKYQAFPSAALAWNATEEAFLQNMPTISSLKLRASYGRVGNAAIDPYQTLGLMNAVTYNYGSVMTTGAIITAPANPDIVWEYTSSLNAGIDFGILENRITGTVEVYHQLTDNLLLNQTLPPDKGYTSPKPLNIGKTENRGLELQISSVNVRGDGRNEFSWTTDVNIFLNRGKITNLASGKNDDIGNSWFIGEPIGTTYDYKKIGIWQNTAADSALAKSMNLSLTGTGSVIGTIKVADLAGRDADGKIVPGPDGFITDADRTIIGNSQPKWQGGFTNRIAYKGFDFTVVGFGRAGSMLISAVHNSGFANTFQGNYNNMKVDYWTPTNGQNTYPKPNGASTNTPYNSTLGYFDGSYLKIRSLTLGYSLPASILTKLGAKSLRVYGTANDALIFFSEYRNAIGGIDPEAIDRNNNRGQVGVDTPATYSIVFGLNASF